MDGYFRVYQEHSFFSYAVAASVVGLIWVWLLDTQYGLINKYLNFLGIENIPWLTSTNWVLIGVSIASIWWDLGLLHTVFGRLTRHSKRFN